MKLSTLSWLQGESWPDAQLLKCKWISTRAIQERKELSLLLVISIWLLFVPNSSSSWQSVVFLAKAGMHPAIYISFYYLIQFVSAFSLCHSLITIHLSCALTWFYHPPQVLECTCCAGRASRARGEGNDHEDHLSWGGLSGSVMQRRDVDNCAGRRHVALWRLWLPPLLTGQEKGGKWENI